MAGRGPTEAPQGPRGRDQMVRIHGNPDIKSGIRALRQHGDQPQQQQRMQPGNLRHEGNIVLYNTPTERATPVFQGE